MEHLPRIAHDNNYHLGDGILSTQASGIFFDSIDRDGDGAIEPEEVALFLQNEIGGKQFDTQLEVDEEVGTIMERLDQNHNNGLEMSDMLSYWAKMESLLTAEEVADWIVYSVQLPRSVGK
jgi:Ca2+-binding EF-hand superfamily protein